jgi:hypothetical protein
MYLMAGMRFQTEILDFVSKFKIIPLFFDSNESCTPHDIFPPKSSGVREMENVIASTQSDPLTAHTVEYSHHATIWTQKKSKP